MSTAAEDTEDLPGRQKDTSIEDTDLQKGKEEDTGSWFARCISVIGSGALVSKGLGLFREHIISSYLGLTGLADAFNLASTFPVLCLTGIGGLNGALHSAAASTAAQLPQNTSRPSNQEVHQSCATTS